MAEWKGVDVLAEASDLLDDALVVFVGGTEHDLLRFKEKQKHRPNLLILGQKSHAEIPLYLKSADVLVIPNSSKESISRLYTSPMKLFEYMASGVSIVASDLPSLREVLSEENAVVVSPDNARLLAEGIVKVLTNPAFSEKIARGAQALVQNYTWEKRAECIINFVRS